MMVWNDHDLTGWGWLAMTIGMLLFWALVVAGGVLLFRALDRPADRSGGLPRPTPEQLLAERFAGGEIDEDEYRRRLATLGDRHRTASTP
jgi:putative membrane protein